MRHRSPRNSGGYNAISGLIGEKLSRVKTEYQNKYLQWSLIIMELFIMLFIIMLFRYNAISGLIG